MSKKRKLEDFIVDDNDEDEDSEEEIRLKPLRSMVIKNKYYFNFHIDAPQIKNLYLPVFYPNNWKEELLYYLLLLLRNAGFNDYANIFNLSFSKRTSIDLRIQKKIEENSYLSPTTLTPETIKTFLTAFRAKNKFIKSTKIVLIPKIEIPTSNSIPIQNQVMKLGGITTETRNIIFLCDSIEILPQLHIVLNNTIFELNGIIQSHQRFPNGYRVLYLENMSTLYTNISYDPPLNEPQSTRLLGTFFRQSWVVNKFIVYKKVYNFSAYYNAIIKSPKLFDNNSSEIRGKIVTRIKKNDNSVIHMNQLQFNGICYLLYLYRQNLSFAILNDPPGMGKTWMVLSTCDYIFQEFGKKKLIIICPLAIESKWIEEYENYKQSKIAHLSNDDKDEEDEDYTEETSIFELQITHYEAVSKINEDNFDVIVVDEAHFYKSKTDQKKSLKDLKKLKARFWIFVTATLFDADFSPLSTLLKIVGDKTTYDDLQQIEQGIIPFLSDTITDPVVIHNFIQKIMLFNRMNFQKVRIRRNLQYKNYSTKRLISILPLSNGHRKKLSDIKNQVKTNDNNISRQELFSYVTNTRKFINKEEIKFRYILELCTEIGITLNDSEPNRMVLFTEFIEVTGNPLKEYLEKNLKESNIPCNLYFVSHLDQNIQKTAKKFSSEKIFSIMIIGIKIGCVGLDIIGANYILCLEPVWNYNMWLQASYRVDRHGQTRDVTNIIVIAEETVEEYIFVKSLIGKNIADILFDEIKYSVLPQILIDNLGSLKFIVGNSLKLRESELLSKVENYPNLFEIKIQIAVPSSVKISKISKLLNEIPNMFQEIRNHLQLDSRVLNNFRNYKIHNEIEESSQVEETTDGPTLNLDELKRMIDALHRYHPGKFCIRTVLKALLLCVRGNEEIDFLNREYQFKFQNSHHFKLRKTAELIPIVNKIGLFSLIYLNPILLQLLQSYPAVQEVIEVMDLLQSHAFEEFYTSIESNSGIEFKLQDLQNFLRSNLKEEEHHIFINEITRIPLTSRTYSTKNYRSKCISIMIDSIKMKLNDESQNNQIVPDLVSREEFLADQRKKEIPLEEVQISTNSNKQNWIDLSSEKYKDKMWYSGALYFLRILETKSFHFYPDDIESLQASDTRLQFEIGHNVQFVEIKMKDGKALFKNDTVVWGSESLVFLFQNFVMKISTITQMPFLLRLRSLEEELQRSLNLPDVISCSSSTCLITISRRLRLPLLKNVDFTPQISQVVNAKTRINIRIQIFRSCRKFIEELEIKLTPLNLGLKDCHAKNIYYADDPQEFFLADYGCFYDLMEAKIANKKYLPASFFIDTLLTDAYAQLEECGEEFQVPDSRGINEYYNNHNHNHQLSHSFDPFSARQQCR